jgi:hypothetical protein
MNSETVLSTSLKRLVAMGMVVLLLVPAQAELFAQQEPIAYPQYANGQYGSNAYPQNQYPQNAPYAGQYPPNQQSGYGQPGNPQQQYPQQPYPRQQADLPTGQNYPEAGQDPGSGPGSGYDQPQPPAQPLSAEQLQQLVAPIALYPDALIAQVLAASTYPAQVASADHWLRAQGNVSPDQVAAGADAQTWDPSVKALTAFPQVLAQMDQDLRWTTDLGNAYYNQPQDVLQTVQIMRQRAQSAGNLQSTPQEQVTEDQGYIQVAPVNPQVVYVPMYNPWYVYGQPVEPYPGFSLFGAIASFVGSAVVRFGPGIALGAFSATPFGWGFWALNWLGNAIFFNHSTYYSHSTSVAHWGYGHGGSYGYARGGNSGYGDRGGYNRSQYNQGRPNWADSGYGRTGNDYRAQNYGSNRGYAENGTFGANRSFEANRGYTGNRAYAENRAYSAPQGNSVRPAIQNYAYNRPQASIPARPQSYARSGGYGSGFYGNGAQTYAARPSTAFASPQRNEFSQRAFAGYGGGSSFGRRSYTQSSPKAEHSGGGFHLFGGGHSSEKSFGGGHAPKSSGGSHGGGGHSSHHR